MYIAMLPSKNIPSTTSSIRGIPTTFNQGEESKYAVADILSSFASREPTSISTTDLLTPTTLAGDLLTPTTLANLEQTFLQLQQGSEPGSSNSQENRARESGFVPPIIDPAASASQMVKQEFPDFSFCEEDESSDDSDYLGPSSKRGRYDNDSVYGQTYDNTGIKTGATPGRKRRDRNEQLNPDEYNKRSLRRERNKMAAAKCRQRRVDLTNKLLVESEGLEEDQSKLENDIQMLQQQKEQLQFLLDAHQPACSAQSLGSSISVKTEKVDIAYPSVLASTASTINIGTSTADMTVPQATMSISSSSRPSSLPIGYNNMKVAGIPITTPSSVLNFGLESMMDGHTGLTPITGTPSCSSQMQRNSTDGSTSSDNMSSPTTLMAL